MSGAASVRQLLGALFNEQAGLPRDSAEPMDLELMRWNLERMAGGMGGGALSSDLKGTSDGRLEVLIEVSGKWQRGADGTWHAHAMEQSAEGAAGAAHLREMRKLSSEPVAMERRIEFLVQLLRDSAYELVRGLLSTASPALPALAAGIRSAAFFSPTARVRAASLRCR